MCKNKGTEIIKGDSETSWNTSFHILTHKSYKCFLYFKIKLDQ